MLHNYQEAQLHNLMKIGFNPVRLKLKTRETMCHDFHNHYKQISSIP